MIVFRKVSENGDAKNKIESFIIVIERWQVRISFEIDTDQIGDLSSKRLALIPWEFAHKNLIGRRSAIFKKSGLKIRPGRQLAISRPLFFNFSKFLHSHNFACSPTFFGE